MSDKRRPQEHHAVLDEMAWQMDDVDLEVDCWHVTAAGAILVPCSLWRH